MACCGKAAVIRVERTPVAVSSPKVVRIIKHNFSAKAMAQSTIKPFNDREKHRA